MNTLVLDNVPNNGHSGTPSLSASAIHNKKRTLPDPQVIQKPPRRRFSTAEKLRILKQADACHKPGELGALLRREGIYSSNLANFRKQRTQGKLRQSDPNQKVTQRKSNEAARQREARKRVQMQKEIQQLTGLLELQKKLSDLLGIHLDNLTTDNGSD
jgi:transposase